MPDIEKVVVLGAGVMGGGIAAHLANAGCEVYLLDLPEKGLGQKNKRAKSAIERLLKANPAPLMDKKFADRITPGNFTDDLAQVGDADWVIEVVIEDLAAKKELYEQLEAHRGENTVISSNTSTIPLDHLGAGRSEAFKQHFLITHFFNPPRYMPLLEVVRGPDTLLDVYERIVDFCDRALGKTVVDCEDTPGFIANRIGIYWLQTAVQDALKHKMDIAVVDQLFSKPLGIPKTGVFGLIDLVGLDIMPLIGQSMKASLPADDPYVRDYEMPEIVTQMIDTGYTGRKGKGGFYRLNRENGQKTKEVLNLETGDYRPVVKHMPYASFALAKTSLQAFLAHQDAGAQCVWRVMSRVLCYAASLVGTIADNIFAIDQAIKSGYNWKYGPFELLDKIGPTWFRERLEAEGTEVPQILRDLGDHAFYRVEAATPEYYGRDGTYHACPRRPGILLLRDLKLGKTPMKKNASAALWDIGDGVACLEFRSKQNSIDLDIITMIDEAVDLVPQNHRALVIHNEGAHFSVGANLGLALFAANVGAWDLIHDLVKKGQEAYAKLKYAPFPVVAAPSGMAVGGGCEILLHSDAVQAHAETYIGLVEVGVGLVPAWGGCREMLERFLNASGGFGGSMKAVTKVFEQIGTAQVAKSAYQAHGMRYLRDQDRITGNRDRLLADAKILALDLAAAYKPPEPGSLKLPGASARVALSMVVKGLVKAGKASPYDEEVAKKLAVVLSGGDADVTDDLPGEAILTLEREAFMDLIKDYRTLARMEHILETGKPLRN